ncbi:MAG: DUF4870 domain-containing protein [Panacagrimonas sp.]
MSTEIASQPSKDECNLAMLAHLLGIFTSFVGALIVWLVKKDDSAFVAQEGAEALNFQITIALGWIIAMMLTVILIGALLYPVLLIVNLVFCILAAVSASKGVGYRYPFTLRLVK